MTEDELAAIRARVGVAEANVVRNDVRALLTEVRRLREALARLDALDRLRAGGGK